MTVSWEITPLTYVFGILCILGIIGLILVSIANKQEKLNKQAK